MRLIANARMYSHVEPAKAAWKQLFGWLSAKSGVALDIIDHAYPAALSDLWKRDDLGCAFICGLLSPPRIMTSSQSRRRFRAARVTAAGRSISAT